MPEPGGDAAFVLNELREFQPDLAARVEARTRAPLHSRPCFVRRSERAARTTTAG